MNTHPSLSYPYLSRILTGLALLVILLSACASAAVPTTAYQAPSSGQVSVESSLPIATEAPAAIEQPAFAPQAPLAIAPMDSIAPPLATSAPAFNPPVATYLPEPGSIPTPVDNFFAGYGYNSYVDPGEDHLSTFALDVDTAAYSVARRYIQDGNLPPAEAIRVEEFVNYFDPGYPTPEGVAFGIYADGALSPFSSDGAYILRFGVQGYQVPEEQRRPASLTFVIDVSGSMDMENRLGLVKQSLQYLVDRLRADDTVAVIVYGDNARLILGPTSGAERNTILQAINSLRPEGSTNAEAGLHLGYQTALQAYRPGAINRVILCSDGVANVGVVDPNSLLEMVRGYVQEGVMLTTVGVGMGNFNDVLMEQLADNGNGFYAYVDTLDEARKLFVEDLTSTLEVIALDAKIQVDFNPEVVAYYRLLGYENRAVADQDFRNDQVDAGEIGAGHSATALYVIYQKPGAQGRLATVQLRWEDPDTHQVQEINGNFNSWDLASDFSSAAPNYRLAVLAAYYAEILRSSPFAQDISLSKLYTFVAPLPNELPWDPDVAEFTSLVSRAMQMRW